MVQKKKMKWYIKLIIILLSVMLVIAVGGFVMGIMVYEQFFGVRYETFEPLGYSLSDFDGLQRSGYEFTSDEGQKLQGYLYHNGEGSPKAVLVFAHGFGGGGHNSYLDIINYFAQHNFYVFAYDATGNDESEGESVKGLPQGVIDLDYALDFVKKTEVFDRLPVVIMGHSWGGYSVTNVLKYHPEVKAAVSFAGFDTSLDLIECQGRMIAGDEAIDLMLPILNIYEDIKFGEFADNTAMDSFEKSEAAVMVLHSEDDETVPKKYGYDIWYEKYKDDPRFVFKPYEDRGHSQIFYSEEAIAYTDSFNEEFAEWGKSLPDDISDEMLAEQKEKYINENLDREQWTNLIDTALFDEILAFYEENLY